MDQIEWGDAEIHRKIRTNQPFANPPGFYIYLLRNNYPVPASFETSQKRRLRDEAQRRNLDARANEAQRQLALYELRERYETFLIEQTDAHIQQKMQPAAVERQIRQHMKGIRQEAPQYRWSEATLRELAVRKLREEIGNEIGLPTLDEFVKQQADRLF